MKRSDLAALFILAASWAVLPWSRVLPWVLVVCLLPKVPRLRAVATVALMHSLYLQLGHASLAAFPWRVDGLLERLDTLLFLGHSPSAWAARHGGEFFQFMYFAFLPFIYTAIALGCVFKEEEFLTGFAFTYAAGLACHILFPARGPVVFLGPSPQDGLFARVVAWCIAIEGGPHAAFPSLHAAASAYVYLFERRHRPRLAAVYLPIVSLVIVSTVFVRYHYVVDLLAAVAIAWAAQGSLAVAIVRLAGPFKRRRFLSDLRNPREAQRRVLAGLMRRLSKTGYGRNLRVQGTDSYEEFKRKVPIVTYDELLPWIEKQKAAEDDSLVSEKVLFYEKTSGSSAASKYIPYTAALRRSFRSMFFLWLHDLVLNGPRLKTWRTFLSVSPCVKTEAATPRGVKIGLEDDSDYVGGWLGVLLEPYLVKSLADDPEVISVWSPASLRELVSAPSLKLLSCWAHANARSSAEELRRRFPGVMIQGKGLLSTEAPVTIPWIAAEGYVPLLSEVFFEFEDAERDILLLHELEVGGEYEVILSQSGGLSRYRTGDRVQVSHIYLNSPCLEFIGRADEVCDLVGEKLNAGFVASTLGRLSLNEARFQKLAPLKHGYALLLDKGSEGLSARLDELLQESIQYKNARLLGQLDAPRVVVRSDIQDAVDGWLAAHGIRSGTVKESALLRHPGLAESLC